MGLHGVPESGLGARARHDDACVRRRRDGRRFDTGARDRPGRAVRRVAGIDAGAHLMLRPA
ncbi:hypothetical protein BCEN4_260010 [Burkholderia cenocepacia]|nr:hypothetical protein BCEN4_260010 [Burkholderia cenocepacia]